MIRNIPAGFHSPFIGRLKELAEVTARLANPDCRLLTLTGMGGSGKTRLALEAAGMVAGAFAHGAVFVGLQPLARGDVLVLAIAQALGVSCYGDAEPHQQLLDYLQDKTLLLLLDNFEHLLADAALVDELLAAAPGVKVLVTSREALSLREEWRYPLKGLSAPQSVYADSLAAYEAVQLFVDHARRAQPDFDLAREHEAVVRICALTAGLPLAIELAAAWRNGSSSAQIAHAIQRNLDVLATTARNIAARHRSMRAVFDQTWSMLAESERRTFARLAVFAGSFAAAAEQVAEASFAGLAALVEKALVQLEAEDRFTIHALLRQYGVEQLDASGETAPTFARHSRYFARLLVRYEPALQQAQQLDTLAAIEGEWANIRQAWEWSATSRSRLTATRPAGP